MILNVDFLFDLVGGGSPKTMLGRMQILICTFLIVTENTGGFFIYSLMYWEKVPSWQCKFLDIWETCDDSKTCEYVEKGEYDRFRVDPNADYSFTNLATQLNL